jgi:hypothetical protein
MCEKQSTGPVSRPCSSATKRGLHRRCLCASQVLCIELCRNVNDDSHYDDKRILHSCVRFALCVFDRVVAVFPFNNIHNKSVGYRPV